MRFHLTLHNARETSFALFIPAVLTLASVASATAQTPKTPTTSTAAKKAPATSTAARKTTAPSLTTDDQKTIYALGLGIYRSLSAFDLSPAELDIVKRAMSDAAAGKPAVELNVWGPKIDPLAKARAARVALAQKGTASSYLTKAATEPGAVKTASGLIYKEIKAGSGASPSASDTVKVNYRGTFVDGKEFDSSYARNEPAEFPLSGVIRCWTEGVQKMKVGGKAHLVCPSDIAYGDQGRPGIPGGSTLVFEIELLSVAAK
jgi:FKBP-type peptidyl-prolyl cis-trans isomerase FkpA